MIYRNSLYSKSFQRFSTYCAMSLFLILCSGIFARHAQAIGESLELLDDTSFEITAESFEYLLEKSLFVAEGSVEILYRNTRLTADYIEFNQLTGDALAIGNVRYEEDGEFMTAEQGEFNFNEDRGIILMGHLALEDDQYISGKKITKIGEKTYLVKRGTFTACDSSWPAWKFWSSRARIEEGEYLQAWNTFGFVKGIPVFYFPYFIYPIKKERQTGFLIPDIGNSSTNGYSIANSFFWAISRSQDATFSHTYYEKRGHKFNINYRYIYSDQTNGDVELEYIRDKITLNERKKLALSHRHGLPYSIKARVNLDWISDNAYDEDFEQSLQDRADLKLESNVSFTKNFSRHTVLFLFDRLDDLRDESDERTDQRFPELSLTSQKQQIFGLPLYFDQKTTVSRLKREGDDEPLDFVRIDTQPTLSLPLNLFGNALTISPEFQFRETYYSRDAETAADTDLDAESVHREYYTASVSVNGPKFNRIFDLGVRHRMQKIKHLIEPSLSFSYRPGIDEGKLPKFDGIDRVGSENRSRSLSYGITQRLLVKQFKEDDWGRYQEDDNVMLDELKTETKELASFSLTQSYDLEAEEYPFSNISGTLKLKPFEDYDLTLQTTLDPYMMTFTTTNIDIKSNPWDFLEFDIQWRRNLSVNRDDDEITDVSQFLVAKTRLDLFNRIGLTYEGRFNVEEKQRVDDEISLTYNGQCWNIIGNYSQEFNDDERDVRYHIILELKHIGRLFKISQDQGWLE